MVKRIALKALRILGIVVLVLLFAGLGWLLVKGLYDADAETRTAIIAASAVLLTGIVAHRNSKRREIEARHFAEKAEAYDDFVKMFAELIQAGIERRAGATKAQADRLAARIVDIRRKLWIWSGPDMIRAWNVYEHNVEALQSGGDPRAMMLELEELIRAMRRDLGHSDSGLAMGELIDVILKADSKIVDRSAP